MNHFLFFEIVLFYLKKESYYTKNFVFIYFCIQYIGFEGAKKQKFK